VKGWEKIFHADGNQKSRSSYTYLSKSKKKKKVMRQRRSLYNDKQLINQENVTVVHTYIPSIRAPKGMK